LARRNVVTAKDGLFGDDRNAVRAVAEIGASVQEGNIMNRRVISVFAMLALSALMAGGTWARAGAYFHDLIKTEPYHTAWTKLVASEHDLVDAVAVAAFAVQEARSGRRGRAAG